MQTTRIRFRVVVDQLRQQLSANILGPQTTDFLSQKSLFSHPTCPREVKSCTFFGSRHRSMNVKDTDDYLSRSTANRRWGDVKYNASFADLFSILLGRRWGRRRRRGRSKRRRKTRTHGSAPSKIIPWSVSWHPMIVRQRLKWSVSLSECTCALHVLAVGRLSRSPAAYKTVTSYQEEAWWTGEDDEGREREREREVRGKGGQL